METVQTPIAVVDKEEKRGSPLENLVGRTNGRILNSIRLIDRAQAHLEREIQEHKEEGKKHQEELIKSIRDNLEDLCDELQLDSCAHATAAKLYPQIARAIFTMPLDNATKVALFREFDSKIYKDRKVGDQKLIILNRDLVELIKIFIMDVDNTIIMSGDHELKPEMVERIRKMIEKGTRIRFVSGRSKIWVVRALKPLLTIPRALELCEIWYESGCGKCDLNGKDLGLAPGLENHPVVMARQEVYDFLSSLCLTANETPKDEGKELANYFRGQDADGERLLFPTCSTKVASRYTLSFNLTPGSGAGKDYQVTLEMFRVYDANGKVINDPLAEEIQEAAMKIIAMAIKNKGWDKFFALAKVGTAININPIINGEIIGKSRAAGMIIEAVAKEFNLAPTEVARFTAGIGDGKADGEFAAATLSDKTIVRPIFFFVGPSKQFDFDEETFDRIVAVGPRLIDEKNGAWGEVAAMAIFDEFNAAFAGFTLTQGGTLPEPTPNKKIEDTLPADFFPQTLVKKSFSPESPDPDYFRYENAMKDPIFREWLKKNGQVILTLGMFQRQESTDKILCFEVRPESRVIVAGPMMGEIKKLMKPEERFTPSGGSSNFIETLDAKRFFITQRRGFVNPKGQPIPLPGHLNNNIGYPAYHPKYGEDLFAQIKGVVADNFLVEHTEELGVIDSATGEFYHPKSLFNFNEAVFSDFEPAFRTAWEAANKILQNNPRTAKMALSKTCKFAPSAEIKYFGNQELHLYFPEDKTPYIKTGIFNFEKGVPNCNGFKTYFMKLPFPSSRLLIVDCEEGLNLPNVLLKTDDGFRLTDPMATALFFQNGEELDPETLPRNTEMEVKEYESLTSNMNACPVIETFREVSKTGVADIILSD